MSGTEAELPVELAGSFESALVRTDRLVHHVVTGGSGPPVLLVNGWPQTWYAWRHVMPRLAERFTVVAAEPRGVGGSEKPAGGYDTASLADDLLVLMGELGHPAFRVVGHDVGMWIGYALAADHPAAVERLVVVEALVPGLSPPPPFFASPEVNNRLFHLAFNRLDGINEALVRGREEIYFGHQFATKTAPGNALAEHAVARYLAALTRDPDALRASFGPYRAIPETVRQNERRRTTPLPMPVLAVGGADSVGELVARTMAAVAPRLDSRVLESCGHYPAEEAPRALLDVLLPFLAEDA